MNIQTAIQILSVAQTDTIDDIRRKYRKLIAMVHPDQALYHKQKSAYTVSEIQEAYNFIKKEYAKNKLSHLKKSPVSSQVQVTNNTACYHGSETDSPCFVRPIFTYYSSDEATETMYYEVTKGRYLWDPQKEPFALYLASIRSLTDTLLNNLGNTSPNSPISDPTDIALRSKLFHLLSQEYILPEQLLPVLFPSIAKDETHTIYKLKGYLRLSKGNRTFPAGTALYPLQMKEQQILLCDRSQRFLGPLSFADDAACLSVLPLLKEKKAQIKILVEKTSAKKRTIDLSIMLRVESSLNRTHPPSHGTQISQLLERYAKKT